MCDECASLRRACGGKWLPCCVSRRICRSPRSASAAPRHRNVMPASAFRDGSFGGLRRDHRRRARWPGCSPAQSVIGADGILTRNWCRKSRNPTTKRHWPRWAPRLSQAPRVRRAARFRARQPQSWPGVATIAGRCSHVKRWHRGSENGAAHNTKVSRSAPSLASGATV